jgi:tetratricopeptide (TPR) repeat protein
MSLPDPIKRWFFNQMAAWCMLFRQRDQALAYYQKMLALNSGDALAMASIGFHRAQQGRNREALAMFDRVVALKPGDAEAHFNRGFLLQGLNDHDGAMAAFDRALAVNPDHDRALYGKALSLIPQAPEGHWRRSGRTRRQPMSPYGWYQLARVNYDPGRSEKRRRSSPLGEIRAEGRAAAEGDRLRPCAVITRKGRCGHVRGDRCVTDKAARVRFHSSAVAGEKLSSPPVWLPPGVQGQQ